MEGIAPPLQLIIHVRQCLNMGKSLRTCLHEYLRQDASSEQAKDVALWLARLDQGLDVAEFRKKLRSTSLQHILELFESGLQGYPIYPRLVEFENEVKFACQIQLEQELATLPIKILLPLVLLMFPAFLIMLFGPLIMSLTKEFAL